MVLSREVSKIAEFVSFLSSFSNSEQVAEGKTNTTRIFKNAILLFAGGSV